VAIGYRCDAELGCAFIVWSSQVTSDEWREHRQRLFADPTFLPGLSVLLDLSAAGGLKRFNSLVVEELADALRAPGVGSMNIAVIPNAAWYTTHQSEVLVGRPEVIAVAFPDTFAACAWLGIPADAAVTILDQLRDSIADDPNY